MQSCSCSDRAPVIQDEPGMRHHIKGGGSPFLNKNGTLLKPAAAPDDPMHVEVYKRLQTVAESGSPACAGFGSTPPPDTIPAYRNGGQTSNWSCCMECSTIATTADCVFWLLPCRVDFVRCLLSSLARV
jgi:hypothetical protein